MDKFKVYESKEETKKPTQFKLENWQGGVKLIAVDSDGDRLSCGTILKITDEGKLSLDRNIDSTLGLDLDSDGEINLDD